MVGQVAWIRMVGQGVLESASRDVLSHPTRIINHAPPLLPPSPAPSTFHSYSHPSSHLHAHICVSCATTPICACSDLRLRLRMS